MKLLVSKIIIITEAVNDDQDLVLHLLQFLVDQLAVLSLSAGKFSPDKFVELFILNQLQRAEEQNQLELVT